MTLLPRSIRVRITALAVVASVLLLGVAAVVMVEALRRQLTDNLDETLGHRADAIAQSLRRGTVEQFDDEDLTVQVVDSEGVVTRASPGLAGRPPITSARRGTHTVRVPGQSRAVRVVVRSIGTADAATLLVGLSVDDIDDPLRRLKGLLAVGVPLVVAALGTLTWWLTSRTLRPVERIRGDLADITARRLDRRVAEPGTGDEIDRLARTTNETLDRLEDAVRRQQRFVADASHELRGPLTRMRSELELAATGPPDADHQSVARHALDETVALQLLVDDLLLLARNDAVDAPRPDVAVDLDDVVGREARRVRERGRIQLDTHGVGAALVTGDRAELARAVRNLLDNAERHASSTVTVTLTEDGGSAVLTVADDGQGIPDAERDHVFDRFTRLDAARTRDAGGSGLGLAITRDIVERHGGSIRLAEGAPTRFVVRLPTRA